MAKNDLKLPILVCFALYPRNCGSYHQDFDNYIYRCFSLYIYFVKKWSIVNIKIVLFLLAHFISFFNFNFLIFFKFINKCQKEILRCVPPSSHVCDFLKISSNSSSKFVVQLDKVTEGFHIWANRICPSYLINEPKP